MRKIRQWLECVLVATIIVMAAYAGLCLREATAVIAGLPGQLDATRAALQEEVAAARIDAFAEIGVARRELLARADGQLSALRSDVMAQVGAARDVADRRLGDSLARVDAAIAQVDLARKDVEPVLLGAADLVKEAKPVLTNAAAVEQDAKDSWDSMYDDVNAAVQSSNVVLTQVGQAALESREAAVANTKNVAGITGDVHALTTAATKPKSFWGKVWAGVTVFSRFAGLL